MKKLNMTVQKNILKISLKIPAYTGILKSVLYHN